MSTPRFTVDTHLFSELGALLVGRDSTALNELVKNAYDADATTVTIHGEGLTTAEGSIVVVDDGIGMDAETFERGFLRIASRVKSIGERWSPVFNRRYTGRKGIGRLAAHKLAAQLAVWSTPDPRVFNSDSKGIHASIDWDVIESLESLDDTDLGIQFDVLYGGISGFGTTIELKNLRRRWSESMLAMFVGEIQGFEPPDVLVEPIPQTVIQEPLLFERLEIRDSSATDPGFKVRLSGDFDIGEDYWRELAERSQWVIEIQAKKGDRFVKYAIGPTVAETMRSPSAGAGHWTYPHPDAEAGPFFSARIFVRATRRIPGPLQGFARGASGVRLYMEGFRVLPYGERGDDWLRLDADYTRRREPFELGGLDGQLLEGPADRETFFRLANNSYYGGVFLTDVGSPMLQMLVNREGFIPDEGFTNLRDLLRRGIDLSVRLRASAESQSTTYMSRPSSESAPDNSDAGNYSVDQRLQNALATLKKVRTQTKEFGIGNESLDRDLEQATGTVEGAQRTLSEARSEQQNLRVVASIGTQLAAFVHEMNALLAQARAVHVVAERLAGEQQIPQSARRTLSELRTAIIGLVNQLERQVSFLTDVVGSNARRRRRRLRLKEQIEIALKLLSSRIERRNQYMEIDMAPELRTPPMFSSELLSIVVNVLSNAVKAAGEDGTILVRGALADASTLILEVANTGEAVDLSDAERWFRPFESTTTDIDEVLGQGMGLGLPIVRRILQEYGGSAQFIPSKPPFATTIQILVPNKS